MKKMMSLLVLFLAGANILAINITPRRAKWSDVGNNVIPRSDADVPAHASEESVYFMKALKAFETAITRSPGAPAGVTDLLYPVQVLIASEDLPGARNKLDEFGEAHADLGVVTEDGRAIPMNSWVQLVKTGFIPS